MKIELRLLSASIFVLCLAVFQISCSRAPELVHPTTIKDLMKSMVDPSADFLFESIREISDEHGVSRHVPETDADWEQVRHHATVLLEAPILITMEDRKVAGPGERSANPLVEKDPDEVQRLINTDRPEFLRRARRLQDAATLALNAANAKDSNALFKAIDGINKACESCHLHYWYPDDRRAQEAAKEDGIAP